MKHDHNVITALSTVNGMVIDNLQKLINTLNLQLKSVFTEEQHGPLPDKGPCPHPVMSDVDVPTSSIDALLSNLNAHKATGQPR